MLVTVRVHPRASRPKTQWKGDFLELWVTAPPVDDAANRAVLEAVARHFGVRSSAVTLRSGGRGRSKVVEIDEGGGRSVPAASRDRLSSKRR